MSEKDQKYDSNGGAVRAGIRDLNDKSDTPYDRLRDEDRLDGKTVLITGATSGLGLAAAKEMASRGGRILIVSRREARAELEAIRSACNGPDASVELFQADMTDFATLRALAAELSLSGVRLDVMISNAAVVPASARRTVDGYEEMLQVNALSPALFILELLKADVIPNRTFAAVGAGFGADEERKSRAAGDSCGRPRIVIVASEAHRSAPELMLDKLDAMEPYGMVESTPRYGWTKLLLLSFARELSRRLSGENPDVSVHALCPGPIASNIAREAPAIARPFANLFFRIFFQSPEIAAKPVVYLAASDRIEGQTGLYQFLMRRRAPSDLSDAPESGKAVWMAFEAVFAGDARLYA